MATGAEIALVLATRNRASQLRRCLDAILQLDGPPFELIVVNNGSTDATPAVIAEYAERFDRFRSAVEPTPGHGYAKNAGLALATAPITSFVDDDCYLDPTFTTEVLREFERQPQIAALGGRIILFDPTDLPITIIESETPRLFPARTCIEAGAIQGANFAFRTDLLRAIGGFDTRMGAGTPFCVDDIDAVARLMWCGHDAAYSPFPLVRHHHGRKSDADARTLHRIYDLGRGAYLAKFIARPDSRRTYLTVWARGSIGYLVRVRSLERLRNEITGARTWWRMYGRSASTTSPARAARSAR